MAGRRTGFGSMIEMFTLAAAKSMRLLDRPSLFGYRTVIRLSVKHAPRQENTPLARDYVALPHRPARVLGGGGGV